jgi:hypothetical protein
MHNPQLAKEFGSKTDFSTLPEHAKAKKRKKVVAKKTKK